MPRWREPGVHRAVDDEQLHQRGGAGAVEDHQQPVARVGVDGRDQPLDHDPGRLVGRHDSVFGPVPASPCCPMPISIWSSARSKIDWPVLGWVAGLHGHRQGGHALVEPLGEGQTSSRCSRPRRPRRRSCKAACSPPGRGGRRPARRRRGRCPRASATCVCSGPACVPCPWPGWRSSRRRRG